MLITPSGAGGGGEEAVLQLSTPDACRKSQNKRPGLVKLGRYSGTRHQALRSAETVWNRVRTSACADYGDNLMPGGLTCQLYGRTSRDSCPATRPCRGWSGDVTVVARRATSNQRCRPLKSAVNNQTPHSITLLLLRKQLVGAPRPGLQICPGLCPKLQLPPHA